VQGNTTWLAGSIVDATGVILENFALTGANGNSIDSAMLPVVPVNKGGTGLTSPTLGQMIYSAVNGAWAALNGNATATKMFLNMASNVPAWAALVAADIPNLDASKTTTGQFALAQMPQGTNGWVLTGTGASAPAYAAPSGTNVTTKGDLQTYSTTGTRLAVGTDGTSGSEQQILVPDSTQTTGLKWVNRNDFAKTIRIYEDFVSAVDITSTTFSTVFVGQAANWQYARFSIANGDTAHPGRIDNSTTTTYDYILLCDSASYFKLSLGTLTMTWILNLAALSSSVYALKVGLGGVQGGVGRPLNCVLFEYRDTTSTNWQGVCSTGGTSTVSSTGVAAATGWITLKMIATSTAVTFLVNGVGTTISTNIPSTINLNPCIELASNGGATISAQTLQIDYWGIEFTFDTSR
jgi:hypothetical protein